MLPPSIDTPLPIRITPPFLQEDLEHPPFQKSQPSINKRGSYYGYSVSFFSFNISIFSFVNSKYERKFQKKSKTTFSRSAQGVGRYNSFSRSCSKNQRKTRQEKLNEIKQMTWKLFYFFVAKISGYKR